MVSEMRQIEKEKYHMTSIICRILKKLNKWTQEGDNKNIDTKNRVGVNRMEMGVGRGKMGKGINCTVMETKLLVVSTL